jgi:hypothetical protein
VGDFLDPGDGKRMAHEVCSCVCLAGAMRE